MLLDPSRRTRSATLVFSCSVWLLLSPACATTDSESDQAKIEESLVAAPSQPTDAQLRLQMMRFASHYGYEINVTIGDAKQLTRSLVHKRGLQAILVDIEETVLDVAAGVDAEINLLDMLVHITLTRMAFEDYWGPELIGSHGGKLVEVARLAEADIWGIGRTVLDAEQEQDLRGLIDHWRSQNPDRRGMLSARFTRFSSEFVGDERLLAIILIDDIRDATAEAREVRLTAERTRFMVLHMPSVVQAKLQLALYDFMLEPDMRAVFDGYAQLAAAAERVGLAAEALPAELERQRREALGDFWVGLAGEREALLGSLAESEDSVLGVLTELRRTLEVSSELAERADRLTARFAPEPGSSANDEPFEIEQYRETAAQVTEAAIRLEQLVVALGSLVGSDERSSEGAPLNLALARATGAVDASLNRAFWLALGLILAAGVTALSVALAYRAIASRSAQRSS